MECFSDGSHTAHTSDYATSYEAVKPPYAAEMRAFLSGTRYAMPMITPDDIRHILQETGWTQSRLGKEVGVAQATVSRWLSGLQRPEAEQQEALNKLLCDLRGVEPLPTRDISSSEAADFAFASAEAALLALGLSEDEAAELLPVLREVFSAKLNAPTPESDRAMRQTLLRILMRLFLSLKSPKRS